MEKSYNRKGNLRFKSSNEAEKFVMEGRKATGAGKLRKKLTLGTEPRLLDGSIN